MTHKTFAKALQQASSVLQTVTKTPHLDAQVLLAHLLQCSRASLLAWPDRVLSTIQAQTYQDWIAQRAAGCPVAYLTGQQEFWSLPFRVTTDTLIPRPETECLVEVALSVIAARSQIEPKQVVADLGTGCGVIACILAKTYPQLRVLAIDQSIAALAIAKDNAQSFAIPNVRFLCANWCDCLPDCSMDVLVANPPYIAVGDPFVDQVALRFEPQVALYSDEQGLADLRAIITTAKRCLKPGGHLIVEHGWQQATSICTLLQSEKFLDLSSSKDYSGHDRVVLARKSDYTG